MAGRGRGARSRSGGAIYLNADGSLDGVQLVGCDFRMEQIGEALWWVEVGRAGQTLHIWIEVDWRGRLVVEVDDDGLGCPRIQTAHCPPGS